MLREITNIGLIVPSAAMQQRCRLHTGKQNSTPHTQNKQTNKKHLFVMFQQLGNYALLISSFYPFQLLFLSDFPILFSPSPSHLTVQLYWPILLQCWETESVWSTCSWWHYCPCFIILYSNMLLLSIFIILNKPLLWWGYSIWRYVFRNECFLKIKWIKLN